MQEKKIQIVVNNAKQYPNSIDIISIVHFVYQCDFQRATWRKENLFSSGFIQKTSDKKIKLTAFVRLHTTNYSRIDCEFQKFSNMQISSRLKSNFFIYKQRCKLHHKIELKSEHRVFQKSLFSFCNLSFQNLVLCSHPSTINKPICN